MTKLGTLFIVSAPSGAGKTSLVKALVESIDGVCVSVSHTTRAIRPGEKNGVNYHFVGHPTFLDMVHKGAFLEHAKVFTNYYGTSQAWVEQTLASGRDVIVEIDWQGAMQVRKILTESVGIYILPPSKESLRERLTGRGQDNETVIDTRMAEAKNEMSHYVQADYLIINDNFGQALHEFRSIVTAERLTLEKQQVNRQSLLNNLLS
ncbi:MAG: guanylate kinase [Lentisphaeria bacterium]|jgi:guanylate kinase